MHLAATDVPVRPDDEGDPGPSRAREESSIMPFPSACSSPRLQVRPSNAARRKTGGGGESRGDDRKDRKTS